MARILAIVTDLMLASRVEGSLRAAGHSVHLSATIPDPAVADVLVCDLDCVDPEAVAAAGLPSLGFYSHVDVEARARAEAAGVGRVVPRSRMARELPALVDQLLDGGAQGT